MTDLDRSGSGFQQSKVWLGPTLGWTMEQVEPTTSISVGGTYTVQPGDSILLVDASSPVTINLPDVRDWIKQTANQPATGFARVILVKDFGGNANNAAITINPFGSQTIDKNNAPIFITSAHGVFGLAPLVDLSGWAVVTGASGPPPALLSLPTAVATGLFTAALGVSTDTGSGTLFWVVETNLIPPPTASQIRAGQDGTGAPAIASGSQGVTTAGVQAASATGLSPPTVYTAHFVQVVGGTNSNVVSSAMFDTTFTAFGGAADRVSMLHPALADGTFTASTRYGISVGLPATLVNQWTPGGSSTVPNNFVTLGAMTTAPDGTNTAQKIVEAATNQTHSLVSGLVYNGQTASITQGIIKLRLSVFAKAAERTRIVLALTDSPSWLALPATPAFPGQSGVKAVFDLSAGTVAVPAAAFNSPAWIALPASITAFSNGWYRCTIDCLTGFWPVGQQNLDSEGTPRISGGAPMLGYFYLDSGSGNAAESSSYVGNGTSGVYAWKSNCNPVSLWALNNRAFFEDFINTTGVDINNTKAPGFNLYVDNTNAFGAAPGFVEYGVDEDFDISSSQIHMHLQDDTTSAGWIWGVISDGTNTGYTGTSAFALPLLMEARMSIGPLPGGFGGQVPIFWTDPAEGLFTKPPLLWPQVSLVEPDFAEFNATTGLPNWVTHYWTPPFPAGTKSQSISPWPRSLTPDFTQFHTYSNYIVPQAAGTPPSSGSRNILPNSGFTGAVAGSPGTLPNNMSIDSIPAGLSVDVASISGGKLQLRFHGNPAAGGATAIHFNSLPSYSSGGGTMLPGQIWTGSLQMRLAAGSDGNVNGALSNVLQMLELNNAGSNFGLGNIQLTLVSAPTPSVLTFISASWRPNSLNFRRMSFDVIVGTPNGVLDFTLEFFQPQLELSAMPTPFQTSFSTGDPAPVLGVAATAAEPFFHKDHVYFDGLHCEDFSTSTLTQRGGDATYLIASADALNQHYTPILGVSRFNWPSHFDWVAVFTG